MSQDKVNIKSNLNGGHRYLRLVIVGIIAVLIVMVAWLTYAYIELNQSNAKLQEEITSLKTKTTPSSDKPIEGYLASSVTLYQNSATPWKATSNKTEVALSLDMLGSHSQQWNFNLPEAEINRLKSKAGFEKLFGGGCLTGRTAASNSIVSLCFSKDGKILNFNV